MKFNVVVVGARGIVGREMLRILAEREFPIREIAALCSARGAGRQVSFGENTVLTLQNMEKFDFSGFDIALFATSASESKKYAPIAAKAGCLVIDNSSHFRMEPDVPLVIPEINPQALQKIPRNIIANPNCSTIQMALPLKALNDVFGVKRAVVSTYQSVSGAGKAAMDELYNQTKKSFVNDAIESDVFSKQIAFNLIPHIDSFLKDGRTKEEWKMEVEIKKILDPDLQLHATCVRVPVFIGHSESLNVQCKKKINLQKARDALKKMPGVIVMDQPEDGGYITPVEVVGEDEVFISRLRIDASQENTLSFWCAADNIRKGAALNAIQIAEYLLKEKKLTPKTS
ncbi:aspartate-semialdehyde dehydrogenase [Acetobacteraceae bacterium]|nr:aspartate-semialdehyde dehydrogenase [Acetobacteraceae bacterium]